MTSSSSPTPSSSDSTKTTFEVNDVVFVMNSEKDNSDGNQSTATDDKRLEGVIQYVGEENNKMIGILLTGKSAGKGNSDGCNGGKQYFACSQNGSIFVTADRVTKRRLTRLEELRLRRELLALTRQNITPAAATSGTTVQTSSTILMNSGSSNNSIESSTNDLSRMNRERERKERIDELRQQRMAMKQQRNNNNINGTTVVHNNYLNHHNNDIMSSNSSVSSITSCRSNNSKFNKLLPKRINTRQMMRSSTTEAAAHATTMNILQNQVLELEEKTSQVEKNYLKAIKTVKEREEEITRLRISLLDCKHNNYKLKRQVAELEDASKKAYANRNTNITRASGKLITESIPEGQKVSHNDNKEKIITNNNNGIIKKKTQEFLDEVKGLLLCRKELKEEYQKNDSAALLFSQNLDNNNNNQQKRMKQQKIDGTSVDNSLDSLYYSAQKTLPVFRRFIHDIVDHVDGITTEMTDIAPLKEKGQAMKKVHNSFYTSDNDTTATDVDAIIMKQQEDRSHRQTSSPPFQSPLCCFDYSTMYDIVRGSIICETKEQILNCIDWLEKNCTIIQMKNRFQNPIYNGYRDILFHIQMNVKLPIRVIDKSNSNSTTKIKKNDTPSSFHNICELQIHLKDIKTMAENIDSYRYYKYFRQYFSVGLGGRSSTITGMAAEETRRLEVLQFINESKGKFHQQSFIDTLMASSSSQESLGRENDNEGGVSIMNCSVEEEERQCRLRLQTIAGLFHYNLAEHYVAMQLYVRELDRLEKINDSSNREQQIHIALVHYNMANLLYDQGNMEDSMLSHEKSLLIREKVLGKMHLDVAQTYYQMARVLWRQWKLDDAMKVYEKALAIRLEILGEKTFDVADIYYNMAIVLDDQEKLTEAMELYKKVLSIWKDIAATTTEPSSLIGVEKGQKDDDEEENNNIVLVVDSNSENNQSQVAALYNNMANVLRRQGSLMEEMKYYEMALAIWRNVLGDGHSKVADTYNNMACVLDEQGELTRAMDLYRKALSIWKRVLGDQHAKVADIHYNISIVYEKKDQFTEAALECSKACDIYQKNYGINHSETMDAQQEVMRLKALVVDLPSTNQPTGGND